MVARLDSPWVRADPAVVWLRDEAGEYLTGVLDNQPFCEVVGMGWLADGCLVANGLVLDGSGCTIGHCSGLLHPSRAERVIFERVGCDQRRAKLLDLEGNELGSSEVLGGIAGPVGKFAASWSPNGQQLAIGAYQALHVVSFDPPRTLACPVGNRALATLVFVGEDRVAWLARSTLRLLDVSQGNVVGELENEGFNQHYGLAVSPDGSEIVVGGKLLQRVPADSLAGTIPISVPLRPRSSVPRYFHVFGFSPDGQTLLVGAGSELVLVDWPACKSIESFVTGPRQLQSAALSRDGARLAAGGGGVVHFWQRGGRPSTSVEPPRFPVCSMRAARSNQMESRGFPSTVLELEARVRQMDPFCALGKPSAFDHALKRVGSFEEWPGPDSEEGGYLEHQLNVWWEAAEFALFALGCDRRATYTLSQLAAGRNTSLVVGDDELDDTYSPRGACLFHLDQVMKVTTAFLLVGWPIPEDLQELFLLFEAGHWPCAYSIHPFRESPTRLLVF